MVVAVLPHPPRPNIVIYSLGESTTLWTHTDEKKSVQQFILQGWIPVCLDVVLKSSAVRKNQVFFFYIFLDAGIVCNLSIMIRHTSVATCFITTFFSFLFLKSEINKLLLLVASPH